MNNFELHEKAQELVESETHYSLARKVVELEEKVRVLTEQNKLFLEALR